MENNDPVMEYGKRFRREMSYSDLAENYEQWKRMLHEEARRIKDSSEARKFMSLESVFAVLCGCLFLKETMTLWEITGCVLVFVAVVLSQIPVPVKAKTK